MVVSKASRGQRKRREREANERKRNQSRIKRRRTANKKPDLIVISSDDEEDNILLLNNEDIDTISQSDIEQAIDLPQQCIDDTPELEEFQENEIEEWNQSNDMVQYMISAIDDDSSDDEILDMDDDPLSSVWPVFSYHESSKISVPRRLLKSGKNHYQQPVENPNSLSRKLIPAPIPRQTKHNQKKRALKALGSTNKTIDNYFICSEPLKDSVADPNIDPNLEFATLDDHQNQSNQQTAQEATQLRLNHVLDSYLSAPKTPHTISKEEKACTKWKETNLALQSTILLYKEKKKKNKDFIIPQFMIDNVTQFNNLRLQYTLDRIESPSHAASLATAKSDQQASLKKWTTTVKKWSLSCSINCETSTACSQPQGNQSGQTRKSNQPSLFTQQH
jgi:hypothetical protein